MFDINRIFDFVTDSSHKLSKRLLTVIAGLALLILVDRVFKFSDNYITSQKLEQVKKIEELVANEKIDTTLKKRLKNIEIDVLNRQTAWGYLSDTYMDLKRLINSPDTQYSTSVHRRSFFWHSLSSSWSIVLLMFMIFIVPFAIRKFDFYTLLGTFAILSFLLVLAVIFSALFALIPILGGNPIFNYVLNFILHIVAMYLFYTAVEKAQKVKNRDQ